MNSDLNGNSPQFTLTCYTLGDLEKGKVFNISIVGTSNHFFSKSVAWELITLTGNFTLPIAGEGKER